MVRNRTFALCFRAVCLLLAIAGFFSFVEVFNGAPDLGALMYYTAQSNMLAIVLFAVLLVKTIRGDIAGALRFEIVCTIDLLLTLGIYWLVLAPSDAAAGVGIPPLSFDNLAAHLLTPLLCLTDYILFSVPGRMRYRDVYNALIFPLAYALFILTTSFLGYRYYEFTGAEPTRFPYFFLDFDALGGAAVAHSLLIFACVVFLGHIGYAIDRARLDKSGESSSAS